MPSEDNIAKLTQENAELREEISVLKRRKKFGLVWEDKPEEVVDRCQSELPVLQEVKKLAIGNDDNLQTNLLIEGDNFHALSVLNYTHAGKIDVIYADPPYNTGARDWTYNNNYVDENDGYRHSKWLSMMASRLLLAKNLLSNRGVFCVAIDHYELFTLGSLCDEIFGERNRLGLITVVHKSEGRQFAKGVNPTNDFMLWYAKDASNAELSTYPRDEKVLAEFDQEDAGGKFRWVDYVRTGGGAPNLRENNPQNWYPVYVSPDLSEISLDHREEWSAVLPVTDAGTERSWNTSKETFEKNIAAGNVMASNENGGGLKVFRKLRARQTIKTHWDCPKYNATRYGTRILNALLGTDVFSYPKSIYLLLDFLKVTSKKDSIILDFFAGSGTTGHAALLLNKEDGGNRQYILCTNNENGIARDVCQPRVNAVIKGHPDLPDLTGVPSNLKYYKTDFVPSVPTDSNKYKLTVRATEMLCVRENTFIECRVTKTYKIYRNQNRYTGIIYDSAVIERFKRVIAKIDGVFNVYVFSFGDDDFAEDFADMYGKVNSKPIPEGILATYRSVFRKRPPR